MAKSYVQLKQELNEIIEKISDPKIEIDEALELHKQAKKLILELETILGDVKDKLSSK